MLKIERVGIIKIIKIMKKLIILMCVFLFTLSCGETKKERIERERIEQEKLKKEMIERESAKILVTYNDAIGVYKQNVQKVIESARLFGWSNRDLTILKGSNWRQDGWDTLRVYFKIDSLQMSFKEKFGEDEYNVLRLKIDENFNEKMK